MCTQIEFEEHSPRTCEEKHLKNKRESQKLLREKCAETSQNL